MLNIAPEILDVALRMTGCNTNKRSCEVIVAVINKLQEIGTSYSLEDAAKIQGRIEEKYEVEDFINESFKQMSEHFDDRLNEIGMKTNYHFYDLADKFIPIKKNPKLH